MIREKLLLGAAGAGLMWTLMTPALGADDPALVKRGEYLARAGDCTSCHTAPGGQPFAGGGAINSPMGAIYAPNITPDRETGIGDWSVDDFYRAMHEGVGKNGEHLYPAFPYPWFTKVTRDDVMAIKAYLDTVAPVSAKSKPTRLMFPFDVCVGVAGWNAAYFHEGEFKPDPAKSDEINRGAYLVEGLGHCGDCHTPKGFAMEPLRAKAFSGGAVDKWYAPNITSDVAHGVGGWSDEDLIQYLKTGSARGKGVAVGPMSEVVHDSLAYLTDEDLHAIATFLKSTAPIADYAETKAGAGADTHATGEDIYLSHCSYCHQVDGKGIPGAVPALDGNGVVRAKGPEDVIRVILGGRLATGSFAPMPPVGEDLTDQQVADVAAYVRHAWSNKAPESAENGLVGAIRAQTPAIGSQAGACRTDVNQPPVSPISDPEDKIGKTLAAMKPETMTASIDQLVATARQLSPAASQADIVNALTLDYCGVEQRDGSLAKPESRWLLTRFSQLVYTEIAAHGKD